jgi:hypothetical protein
MAVSYDSTDDDSSGDNPGTSAAGQAMPIPARPAPPAEAVVLPAEGQDDEPISVETARKLADILGPDATLRDIYAAAEPIEGRRFDYQPPDATAPDGRLPSGLAESMLPPELRPAPIEGGVEGLFTGSKGGIDDGPGDFRAYAPDDAHSISTSLNDLLARLSESSEPPQSEADSPGSREIDAAIANLDGSRDKNEVDPVQEDSGYGDVSNEGDERDGGEGGNSDGGGDGGEDATGSNSIPHDDRSYTGVAKGAYPDSWDPIVEREVKAYNDSHGFKPGNPQYLDPARIKAMIRVESRFDMDAYRNDPMQVNKSGDWMDAKAKYGLQKGVPPGPEQSIRAGIQWLADNAYPPGRKRQLKNFKGWNWATEGYNGHGASAGDSNYLHKVKKQLQVLGK